LGPAEWRGGDGKEVEAGTQAGQKKKAIKEGGCN